MTLGRAAGHVPATCSAFSAIDEPLPGTAAVVHRWLCIEHPGAWGRDVVGDAPLGADLTAELDRRCNAAGFRLMLIRRPGRPLSSSMRQVFIASSVVGDEWCERLEVSSAAELLDLPFESGGVGTPVTDPIVLVCVHGKRDQCCARLGRPIASGLAMTFPDLVWECSHTGGHRFAPSLIMLPSGYTYGRLDLEGAQKVIEMARNGSVSQHGLRGRSCYSPGAQAAEIAIRELVDATVDELTVEASDDAFVVSHQDGRTWGVEVTASKLPPREVSCGASPKPVESLAVSRVWARNAPK